MNATAKRSRKNPSPESDEAIFISITESAFEFLERAISEFSETPKFSTIHFATAVELFLKARLMREHWSLIVEDPDKAKRPDFLSGKSRTVTPSVAITRLQHIAGVTIAPDAERAFAAIADHRNKMIHFVHEDEKAASDGATMERVAIEQCRGWLQLERLLGEWSDHFDQYVKRTKSIRRMMKQHHAFLHVIFERLSPEIKDKKAAGIQFTACHSCGFASAELSVISDQVANLSCLVCETSDSRIVIGCPNADCEEIMELRTSLGEHPSCPKCDAHITEAVLSETLDTDDAEYFDHVDKNCALCTGWHTVIAHHEHYICTQCLAVEREAYACGWCNELQIGGGDLEMSYVTGCEFCDGRSGWDRDDD